MGILSAVFGRKKSENTSTDRYKLYDALKTYARIESSIADRISKSIEEGGDVVFSDAERGADASEAFRISKDFLNGKPLKSLTLDYIHEKDPLIFGTDIRAEKLIINRTYLAEEDWDKIAGFIEKGNIKSLTVSDVDKDDKNPYPPFKHLKSMQGLEELCFEDCSLRDSDFTTLATELVSKSALKKLTLPQNFARGNGLNDIIRALPDTIEEFGLRRTPLCAKYGAKETLEVLADKVEKMPNLKVLDLSDCDLDADSLKILMPKLPPTLKVFNLADDIRMDNEALTVLIDHLRNPNCHVTETNASTVFASDFFEDLKRQLKEAEESNAAVSLIDIQKQKADEIAKAKGEKTLSERIKEADAKTVKTFLHAAVQNGLLTETFNRMAEMGVTLNTQDLNATNKDGETFVQSCIKMKQVETLMRPEMYGNAKDYQNVYNALPDSGKRMFDGQNGRPAFSKMKNQVMANAVKKMVANKSVRQA